MVLDDDTNEKGTAGPFSCRAESGLGKLLENYKVAITPWDLVKRRDYIDVMFEDEKLAKVLAKCHQKTR